MEKDKPLTLSLAYAAKLHRRRLDKICEDKGIPGAYLKILLVIDHEINTNQLAIVNNTHLAAPTVSLTLKKMESEGIIKREIDQNDQRNVIVRLDETGLKMIKEIKTIFMNEEKRIANLLTDDEYKSISSSMEKIVCYLEDANENI